MKRIVTALLMAAMVIGLAACGGEGAAAPADGASADGGAAGGDAAGKEINYKSAGLPDTDLGGYEFVFLDNQMSGSYDRQWYYMNADEITGEPLNDAMYQRNRTIEEAYNVKITENKIAGSVDTAKSCITAGDDAFDSWADQIDRVFSVAQQGMLYDLNAVQYLDMSQEWWDQSVVRDLSVRGHLYGNTGDISPLMNIRVFSLVFNKDLCKELSLEMPYDMVKDGKWTLETFTSYTKGVNQDLNGDGVMDHKDRWGFYSEDMASSMFFISNGGRIAEIDKNGVMVTNINSEINVARLTAALAIIIDKNVTLKANSYVSGEGGSWAAASAWYAAGGALLRSSAFEAVPRDYRAMDPDFGILPFPKYNEAQDGYVTCGSESGYLVTIPITAADPARTGLILEALAAESVSTVSVGFYDVCLNGKSVRDNESSEMLDIIFDGKVLDIGYMLNVGNFRTEMTKLEKIFSTNVTSMIASTEGKMVAALNDYMTNFDSIA